MKIKLNYIFINLRTVYFKNFCPMKIINHFSNRLFIAVTCSLMFSCDFSPKVQITGELKEWHNITFTFTGPESCEYDTINPFTDYRLDIEFSDGQQQINVPGYFAADGNAAETSAGKGNKWRVHFCPPNDGTWNYKVRFLKGKNIAVAEDLSIW